MKQSSFIVTATRALLCDLALYLSRGVFTPELLSEASTGVYVVPARLLGGGDA